ncbi:SMEK domain-containing protein [Photobacterium leiognathi]|uniref:SMEK domain-containing protein n=1 Tax=Photobacterium leiognathi TaxID=553611 RepID=UPI000D158D75|nr:SMEK domain-containing protein [Photobacterium leiognathi]PSW56843.1 hypothetical protein C0W50_10895 [Photobacterium leiognathi subsp. mandapamensis]
MLKDETYIKSATKYLSILSEYTEAMSSLNLNDCSVISENFFSRLINIIYGFELKNINIVKQNNSVIDLYDEKNRISVQVTSTSKLNKIKDCLTNFVDKKLYDDYDVLYIYILTKKQKSYKVENESYGNFAFDSKIHVIDKIDLLRKMQGLDPVVQKEVIDILVAGMEPLNDEPITSNEVTTIINLITLLSDNERSGTFNEESDIDPNRKIPKRFKEKAIIIENQYFNLCLEYSSILDSVEKNNDIDSAKHSKVALFLKDKSTQLLIEHEFDAMTAFEELKNSVTVLFLDCGINFDEMAIKFYLLKHLTQCNVFPLLRGEN